MKIRSPGFYDRSPRQRLGLAVLTTAISFLAINSCQNDKVVEAKPGPVYACATDTLGGSFVPKTTVMPDGSSVVETMTLPYGHGLDDFTLAYDLGRYDENNKDQDLLLDAFATLSGGKVSDVVGDASRNARLTTLVDRPITEPNCRYI